MLTSTGLRLALLAWLLAMPGLALAQAPDPTDAAAADSSSERAEESDEAYRRRMELEDARDRDPLLNPSVGAPTVSQEKIDKLPQASQEHIRDQVIDVIMQSDEWEPFDALREYPYAPTEAAERDPDLLAREQAAWDEQIEKYHEREAAAYAARRAPEPGAGGPGSGSPGDAGDRQAAATGQDQGSGQNGAGAEGQQGDAGDAGGSAGTYSPYESSRTEAESSVSTAGVQQSALEFLRGGQAGAPPATAASAGETAPAAEAAISSAEAGEASPEEDDLRGLVAIEDLDKLEDAANGAAPAAPPPDDD